MNPGPPAGLFHFAVTSILWADMGYIAKGTWIGALEGLLGWWGFIGILIVVGRVLAYWSEKN